MAFIAGFLFGMVVATIMHQSLGYERTAAAQQQSNPCPAGSYNIGTKDGINPICKLEPTGCPYGDSIPLGPDCDKHAPQPEPEKPSETITPPATVNLNQCGGK